MQSSSVRSTIVAISKGVSPKNCVINGIDHLGGISNFIKNEEQVFIKINLPFPGGFPTTINIDTLESIIELCHTAGAKKIYVGSFPMTNIPMNTISNILGLKQYLLKREAELVLLDNSDYLESKNLKSKHLEIIKVHALNKVNINNKEFEVPKIILDSDKFISINQVNVDPILKIQSSIFNSFSIIQPSYQEEILEKCNNSPRNDFDEYLNHIIDVFSIKVPNLAINDMFYVLEGAGPCVYKDSNLKMTQMMVMGNEAIAVDTITLKLLGLDIKDNELLIKAKKRNIGISNISNMKILGEDVDKTEIAVKFCESNLSNIKIPNFSIRSGITKIGDLKSGYHFLNFIKTYLIKDIKYLSKVSFLIGDKPPETELLGNIILFGDNAIESTKNYDFKKMKKSGGVKNILEIPGNPPNIKVSLKLLLDYFGKGKLPMLHFYQNLNKFYFSQGVKN
jgi:uncharacterized protein (DUF362 family)